jgi:fido (protein-threonine AMPylation protein)
MARPRPSKPEAVRGSSRTTRKGAGREASRSEDVPLPPLLFPGRTALEKRWLAGLKKAGRVRAVGPRLYTSLPGDKLSGAVRAGWMDIVSALYPDALVSHRTALEFRPTGDGDIWLTSSTNRVVSYPGLRLRFVRGPGPRADDPTVAGVRSSSRARAFLENLATTHPSSRARSMPQAELEQRLEQLLHLDGEQALNELRDQARRIADDLDRRREYARLDALIGGLLGTRTAPLTSDVGRARAAGEPFDPGCQARLQALFAELHGRPLPRIVERFDAPAHLRNKAFFEAYFSNYIEGTTFEIEEAEQIVFDHQIPARRPKDGHEIAATFRLVSDPVEMRATPHDFDQLVQLLQARHRTLMAERPEVEPGVFKQAANRAGDTHFVEPVYVRGTLRKGMELYLALTPGLARAIYLMFLVTDVHPFVDGNGRIARIMMNAELVSAGQPTIIVPTVYREDYLLALRALTRRHRPAPLIEALTRAQRFGHLDFASYPSILQDLQRRNWFREPDEARLID